MKDSRLQVFLTVIPVLSGALYVLGIAYHQGYLGQFGVEESLFQLSVERTLATGMFAFVSLALAPSFWALLVMMLVVLLVSVATILSSAPRVKAWQLRLIRWFKKRRPTQSLSPTTQRIFDGSELLYTYSIGIFILIISLALIPLLATKLGGEQALREMEQFHLHTGSYVILHSPELQKPAMARTIYCGEGICAYWLGNEGIILRSGQITKTLTYNTALKESVIGTPVPVKNQRGTP